MTDAPKLNPFGYVNSPPLTKEQEAILTQELAEGNTLAGASRKAGCTADRARGFRNRMKTAEAIKALQQSTIQTREFKNLVDVNNRLVDAVEGLEARLCAMETQTRKLRLSVAYQKIGLTEKRKEARAWKDAWRELRAMLHGLTGTDVEPPSPDKWKKKQ